MKIVLNRKKKCKVIKGKHMFFDDVYKVQFGDSPPVVYFPILADDYGMEEQFITWSDSEHYEFRKFVEVNL